MLSSKLLSAKKSNLLCCGIIDLEACKPCRPTAACIIAGRRGQNTARCRSFVNAAFSFLEKTLCGDLSYKLLVRWLESVYLSQCLFFYESWSVFLTVRYTVPVSNVAATIGLYYCQFRKSNAHHEKDRQLQLQMTGTQLKFPTGRCSASLKTCSQMCDRPLRSVWSLRRMWMLHLYICPEVAKSSVQLSRDSSASHQRTARPD